jgi:RNA polymerase sigma-54 factor
MKYRFSAQQKFLQKMTLTPQMRQSINMLGMSVTDLSEYIEYASTQNPFLQKILDNQAADKYKNRAAMSGVELPYNEENKLKNEENPRFLLLSQIKMAGISDKSIEIAEYLIFEMDDNGYITVDPDEAASDLGVNADDVLDCIDSIQSLEPAGIGAKDITECLQLQLRRKSMEGSLEYRIVSSHLAEVAREEIEKMSKALKAGKEDIKKAIANIKMLNPRPASSILSNGSEKVVPELTATFEKKKVRLELNRGAIPGLKLYNPYENDFNIVKDPEARKFMKDNINAAKTLIDNLKRREDTVCKVSSYLLNFQIDSFDKTKHDIKSLTIRDVAKALGLHPSTISRTVSNKYIQIDDKVIRLSSLLSTGMKKTDGSAISKAAIRDRIAKLVRGENSTQPLGDDEIKEALRKEGIMIQRRTVAKYRNALKILPKHLRRKVKAA